MTAGGVCPEDPELTQRKLTWLRDTGTHIMGRVTYEQMAAFWPSATDDYKDLIAWGGASFAQSLARLGLIDEYRLVIHPIALGRSDVIALIAAGTRVRRYRPYTGVRAERRANRTSMRRGAATEAAPPSP